ncbi:hypothetical protein ESCO_006109 [Escovopsis weberi]|uniref:Uncharacterized protein n=1 Tax=Escovopsis weberi TaxID=150374 RepID=A0A0M8N450_ESCWE|nr:hypothetical protein ESCO_006109 [Escovopsis weberi]
MAEPTETIKKIKLGLEPFIKPREQVNYIRRVLALHLGACCGHDGPIRHPLSLADSSRDVEAASGLSGNFREYVEALQANIAARRQLDELLRISPAEPPISQQQQQQQPKPRSTAGADLLEERICLLKWNQKLQSLHAVRQSLDSLMEKPAATGDFLDAKQILDGTPRRPRTPEEVGDALVVDQEAPKVDLAERIQQLERTVLRARLKLKQEEQALGDARARCKAQHDAVSNSTRYSALKSTRDELTGWIESELCRVPPEYVNRRNGVGGEGGAQASRAGPTLSSRLDEISGKYAKYVTMRRTLLDLAAHKSQPPLLAPAHFSMSMPSGSDKPPPAPVNFLITPYLNTLIAVSAQQRALLGQKSAISSALGRESQETCQLLGHLGEESQLLVKYPMKDSLRRRSGIQHEIAMRSSEQPDISERIKPWVFAADSAKIATLETVAETVEGGQVALESSMSLLHDIDVLLGREDDVEDEEASAAEEPSAEDSWHRATRIGTSAKRPPEKKKKKSKKKPWSSQDENDVWSKFHGDLGLLSQ